MNNQRNEEIKVLFKTGTSQAVLAHKFQISRQRVHQIATGYSSPASKTRQIRNPLDIKILTGRKRKALGLSNIKCQEGMGGRDYFRELVRARDKHTCQDCGKKWEKGCRRFDVHHLDEKMDGNGRKPGALKYDKENMDRLITLCHKCHFNLPETRDRISNGRK
jgi:hypothetical protein